MSSFFAQAYHCSQSALLFDHIVEVGRVYTSQHSAELSIVRTGCALLLAVVDTSVFISGHGVLKRLVETMEAADDPVRSRDAPPFQLRIQLVVPFQAS